MKKALVIAAHPDDEVLGCGGIISKYRSKNVEFMVVFIGEGSTCRYDDISSESAKEAIRQRASSAERAMNVLRVENYQFHNLPCGRLDQVPIISINKIIEAAVLEFDPDTVFTHSSNDVNNDHRIVFNATVMATRPVGDLPIKRVFSYEVPSSSEWAFASSFAPNYFEQITEANLSQKWEALSAYSSEVKDYPFPRSEEGLRVAAKMRGMQAGFTFAEAFCLIREFKK